MSYPQRFETLILLTILGPAMLMGACRSSRAPQGISKTVIVGEAAIHQKPSRFSPKIASLTFGKEVQAIAKKSPAESSEWTEIRLDKDRSGFVRGAALGTPKIMETFQHLDKSIEGMEPQASGVTIAPTYLRLEPGRQGKRVEKLPSGTRFEMFQRRATIPKKAKDSFASKPPPKEIWYKVRLTDGRVGYIFTRNFQLEPPSEISNYAQYRRPMAWQKLRTVKGEGFGSVDEYIVAYATPNSDFGADFDRIEVYFWDGKRYQTAFFVGSLRGILPLKVIRENDEVYFEIIQLDPDHKNQVIVSRYLYDYPYKIVGNKTVAQEVGLH